MTETLRGLDTITYISRDISNVTMLLREDCDRHRGHLVFVTPLRLHGMRPSCLCPRRADTRGTRALVSNARPFGQCATRQMLTTAVR